MLTASFIGPFAVAPARGAGGGVGTCHVLGMGGPLKCIRAAREVGTRADPQGRPRRARRARGPAGLAASGEGPGGGGWARLALGEAFALLPELCCRLWAPPTPIAPTPLGASATSLSSQTAPM